MKKFALLMVLVLMIASFASVHAEILPRYGEGQIGYIAVVLCEQLTVRQGSTTAAPTVTTVKYGSRIIVDRQADGWAHCFLGDSEAPMCAR